MDKERVKAKDDDSGKLRSETEYAIEIARVPTAELFAGMPDTFGATWAWDASRSSPPPEEIAEVLGGVASWADVFPESTCAEILSLMEGRPGTIRGGNLDVLVRHLPMRIDITGDTALRLTLPAEFLDAWPTCPAALAIPSRRRRLAEHERALDALANLYGAIALDDALSILRGLGLWDDARDTDFLEALEFRSHIRIDSATRVFDGVVYLSRFEPEYGLALKEAKALLRFVDGMSRWIPATAEALLGWSDPGYVEDTPINAAVMAWALEHTPPGDCESPRAMVAEACRQVRVSAAEDPYVELFDNDEDGREYWGPPPGFRDQFIASQRRWIVCGHNEIEMQEWGKTPEAQIWFARKRSEKASRKSGKKKNKKHGKRR